MTDQQTQHFGPSSARGSIDERETDLLDYLRVVWRHRWMILVLSVVAMSLMVAATLSKPRRYQSSVTIVPPLDVLQKEAGMGGLGAMGNSMLRNIIDTGSIAGIYVEVLESREVADSIVDRFHLMDTDKGALRRSVARGGLKANTKIKTTEEGVVRVTVTDTDPNRCAAIANAYVDELDRQNKRLSGGQVTSKRLFLENRLKEIEQRFSRIENMPAHEAQVQEMLYELLIREYELAKIEEAKSMPTIQVLDQAVAAELPVGRGTVRKAMMAGVAALMFGMFLAFVLEYLHETKQAGLARQFERATRRRKAAAGRRADRSGDNGAKNVAEEVTADSGDLMAHP